MSEPTAANPSLRRQALVRRLERLWEQGQQPDPLAFLGAAGPSPPAVMAAVLAADQWQRWQAGQRVPAEDYLRRCPALAGDPGAALEVIYGEFLVRQALGEGPTAAEYLERFPQFAARLVEQFELFRALEAGGGAAGNGPAALPQTCPPGPSPAAPGPLPDVPGYEVLGELGRGGMGVVYRARQKALNRVVALKMILSGAHAGPEERQRFLREAEAVARLQHPNIVQIHEVGEADGHPFFSLEFCPGGSLAARLNGTPLPPAQAAPLAEALARAVQAAHDAGVVHRDLKPANVLLMADGTPKVTDFGLAKKLDGEAGQTASGAILGTPSYMAPEQAAGESGKVGPPADVYALGAVLYESLTGRPPFKAATPVDTLLQVISQEPVPPGRLVARLPRDLETICLKCLHKEPHKRYASALALAGDLRRFREGRPITARPVGPWERGWKWARRRPAAAGLLGLGVVTAVAVAALLVGLIYGTQLEAERNEAQAQRGRAEAARVEAEGQRRRAEAARDEADQAKAEVERQKTEAEHQRDLVRRTAYAAHTNLAAAAWRDADIARMLLLLEEQRPERTGGQDLRGFEWQYLWRLAHRDTLTCTGHTGPVQTVCFSPDGRRLASASSDGVRVWDAQTGQEALTLQGKILYALGVCFSPDGQRLATASAPNGTVKVWDAQTGKEQLTLPGLTGLFPSLSFSPDGRRLATGSMDKTAKLWDAQTGQEQLTLRGHTDHVTSVSFSPDGQRLATASDDKTAKVWDAQTGQEQRTLQGHTDHVASVCFSPDGRHLASTCWDGTVKLWDAQTGQEECTLKGHTDRVWGVRFSPDGRRLASASWDRTVKVWDAQTGQGLLTLQGHTDRVRAACFSPDGRRVATASDDRTVKVWDAHAGQDALSLKAHTGPVYAVCFSPDGRRLATASADQTVKVWDPQTGQQALTLQGHTDRVWDVGFSPDGRRLASASDDRTVRVWDAETAQEERALKGHTGPVKSVCFGPGGKYLASASGGYEPQKTEPYGEVKVWDAGTGRDTLPAHGGKFSGVAASPDGRRLASAGGDGTVKVWDLQTGQETLSLKGHTQLVYRVCFSPDGRRLASASADRTVRVWDAQTGQELLTLTGHTWGVTCVCFSPDGRRLATASWDKTVKVWDAETGQEALTLPGHTGPVWGVCFSPDGRRLASGDHDGTVKVWEAGDRGP
jgi:WD40 repeat protein